MRNLQKKARMIMFLYWVFVYFGSTQRNIRFRMICL